MQGRTPSAALALVVALAVPALAGSPADKFKKEVLQPAVQNGLQDDAVTSLQSQAEGQPGDVSEIIQKIQKFRTEFNEAKTEFKAGQQPQNLDGLRGEIHEIIENVGIKDAGGALETTYMAQIAPPAAVNERAAQDVQNRMKVLEQKIPPGKRAQYQDSIAKFNAAAASGNWQDASTQFRSLYDNMKNDGSPDIKDAMGQANVIVRNMKPRPAESAVQFTANKSAFEGGLKINNNIPTPYSADEQRKHDATTSGKHLGVGMMATGGGVLAWTGAAALGIVSAPAVPVILLGLGLAAGGLLIYKVAKGSEKTVRQARPEDEQDIPQ